MKNQLLFLFLLLALVGMACQNQSSSTNAAPQTLGNPPAEGFNEAASDAQAITIADSVMEAMGGRTNWDNTRHLAWNFFGARTLVWDKKTGNVRIEIPKDSMTILVNIHEDKGQVKKGDVVFEQPDSLKKYLERGKNIWINDSYWLVMPFKLKDSGVTLKYVGQDTTQLGEQADVLSLTFEKVGVTPQNKYLVYADKEDNLIKQWDFYANAMDTVPRFQIPWQEYQPHGKILLSGNRGKRGLTDIGVYEELSPKVYTSFETIDLN